MSTYARFLRAGPYPRLAHLSTHWFRDGERPRPSHFRPRGHHLQYGSTATFHWVLDHPRLFRQLEAALKPGGRLHAQCGGGSNLDRLHARAHRLMREPVYAPFFTKWHAPWEFADAGTTARRLEEAGLEDVETSVEPAPVVLGSAGEFTEFVTAVILRDHLTYLPDALKRFVRRGGGGRSGEG